MIRETIPKGGDRLECFVLLGGERTGGECTEAFVRETKEGLGIRAMGRVVIGANEYYELREPETSYKTDFGQENDGLRQENTYFVDLSF